QLCPSPPLRPASLFTAAPTTELYTLSLHDALPIFLPARARRGRALSARRPHRPAGRRLLAHRAALPRPDACGHRRPAPPRRGGEIGRATSELQSRENLVCRLLLEKKKSEDDGRQHE